MNELMYNFLNQIEDSNQIKEMTVEEFAKLVKSNKLISDDDAEKLIESFKKIASKKDETTESDSDQRKKRYRDNQKTYNQPAINKTENELEEKGNKDNSMERD